MKKPIFMGTTKVAAEKTAIEITSVLVASGARQIACDYSASGKISALRFSVTTLHGTNISFLLPVRSEPLVKALRGDKARAERVAWRQILRWVQAQLALIEVGMVRPEEVYTPYVLGAGGITLYQQLEQSRFKGICAPEGQ